MIHRLHLADVVYPDWHPNDGTGPVYAFAVTASDGLFLVDTGIGPPHPRIDAIYQPTRFPLETALRAVGLDARDLRGIVISHLHFDHIGNAQSFPGVPVYVQAVERDAAREKGYTIPEFVEAPGIDYYLLDGGAELAPGFEVIPTPGHSAGHQSVLVDGTDLIAAQAFETIDDITHEQLNGWLGIGERDIERIYLSHDERVWHATAKGG
jgi:N-acyl homoserine lactone hydrolase